MLNLDQGMGKGGRRLFTGLKHFQDFRREFIAVKGERDGSMLHTKGQEAATVFVRRLEQKPFEPDHLGVVYTVHIFGEKIYLNGA